MEWKLCFGKLLRGVACAFRILRRPVGLFFVEHDRPAGLGPAIIVTGEK